jgi:protein translocase SecG subunit
MAALYSVLAFAFGSICVFMILLVLIQKGRGGGLSSAFGGAGGNTAFGSKTGDVLTWVTSVVFVLFLLLSFVLIWTGDAVYAAETRVAGEDEDAIVGDADGGGVQILEDEPTGVEVLDE